MAARRGSRGRDTLNIDTEARVVTLLAGDEPPVTMRVPAMFGEITSAERRGEYVLVLTEIGRVSYHAEAPPRVSNMIWRREHPLAGKMHWHSIRKALRTHCLLPQLQARVDVHITHSRYSSGARSNAGGGGHVTVDEQTVLQCSAAPSEHGCRPAELGSALAEYLFLQPEVALRSGDVLIAAFALLDRRLPGAAFQKTDRDRFPHPMWTAFYDLRGSFASQL